MRGRTKRILTALAMLNVVVFASIPTWAGDPSAFDPQKKFSILAGSAVMGDPARYINLGTEHVGGTVVSTMVNPNAGLTVMASLIEPGQNGQPGNGSAIMLTPQEAARLINLLRKGPNWEKIARENNVSDYAKTVGYVRGEDGDSETVAVVFVASANNSIAMQLEHQIAGITKKFAFDITSAVKFSNQLLHYLASAGSEFAPENPKGDAEKDKLFN